VASQVSAGLRLKIKNAYQRDADVRGECFFAVLGLHQISKVSFGLINPAKRFRLLEAEAEFIRLLTPEERQAFMADVWKLINLYCRRIGGWSK
jgi:hypothetical protein